MKGTTSITAMTVAMADEANKNRQGKLPRHAWLASARTQRCVQDSFAGQASKTRFGLPLILSQVHWVEPRPVTEITYLSWTF